MSIGGFFLILVLAIVVIGLGVALWGFRAGMWARETSKNAPADDEQRPDHTTVDEQGNQTFTPHR